MSRSVEEDLTRVEQIRRQRALKAANAALSAIVMVQLCFAAFAVGHALGPAPMRRLELVAGIALSFVIGIVLSLPFVRRRVESGAELKVAVTEGRHRRTVLVFDDHLVLDQEVVMFDQVCSADVDGKKLVLKYDDPIHGGRMLRELEGRREGISALASRIGDRSAQRTERAEAAAASPEAGPRIGGSP
jgi:hypothetical protein